MADNNLSESSYRSRYGIEKLRDHIYHTWSFQCRMLLSEKKVWDVINGKITRPQAVEDHPAEEQATLKDADKRRILKEIAEWDEKNEEALRIISFMVIDRLQGPYTTGSQQKAPGMSYARYTLPTTSRENTP